MKRAYRFTLLEIVICISILAMVAGVVSIQIKKALDTSRFQNSVKQLYNELEHLQVLALTYRSDMRLEITKKDGKWIASMYSDEKTLQSMPNIVLSGVSKLKWNKKEVRSLSLDIYSSGHIEPKGVIGLITEESKVYIDLQSPLQIKITKKYPTKDSTITPPEKPKDKNADHVSGLSAGRENP